MTADDCWFTVSLMRNGTASIASRRFCLGLSVCCFGDIRGALGGSTRKDGHCLCGGNVGVVYVGHFGRLLCLSDPRLANDGPGLIISDPRKASVYLNWPWVMVGEGVSSKW